MFSSSSSKFDSLPTRPPTPPRETSKAIDDAISFLDDCNEVDRLLSKAHTLQDTSFITTEHPQVSSGVDESTESTSKKVGFSPHATYYNNQQAEQLNSPGARSIKRSPIPKNTKPLRSILKPSDALVPLSPEDLDSKLSSFSPQVPGSFAKMLQSVIQQFGAPARSSRLDAYLALNGVLKTYEGVPDSNAMIQKMDFITQFLTRDMAWKDTEGNLDVNIVTQALKLTYAMLFDSKLVQAFDDDFQNFVVDRSLGVLEQADMPKAIIKAHLCVLSQQRFRPHAMTGTKVDKLVTALQTIEDRCSGNSAVVSRLAVYQRLFVQSPGIMLTRIRHWLEHLFHGMLSSVKTVQTKAIETCMQAAIRFGEQPHASKALRELFETEVEDGQTYCDFLILRLGEMVTDREAGASVPSIWASVILFFRSKRMPLERWPTFKSWLLIIQRCFNSSDISVRYQATRAWNKLVFVVMPGASTSANLMSMLRIPIASGMEKLGSDKFSQNVRYYAADSYYNLLHYAFRPGLSNEEYDVAWDTFVDPLLLSMAKFDGKGQRRSTRVLRGLFNGNTGVWKTNDSPESIAIKPEDLPKLDPRWIRSRVGRILKLLEPRISAGLRYSTETSDGIDILWPVLMQSIADAGSQEVRTSNDLKQAISHLVNVLHRLWNDCNPQDSKVDESSWLKRYLSLIETMITSLGAGPFVEDILHRTKDDVIEVAPTPPHRHSKDHTSPQSPLAIILEQFYHPAKALAIDEAYERAAFTLLRMASASKPDFQSNLELLDRTLQTCSPAAAIASQPSVNKHLWTAVAKNAVLVLKSDVASASDQQSQSLGLGLRHATDLLSAGLNVSAHKDSHQIIEELYDAIYDVAKTSAGDGAVVLALMEPFAKSLIHCASTLLLSGRLKLACHMLRKGTWPRARQSIEQARKLLWGVGLPPQKTSVFDPFEHVYVLIQDLAAGVYDNLGEAGSPESDMAREFSTSVIEFLEKSPTFLLGPALRKVQDSFALWLEDKSRKTGANKSFYDMIHSAWPRVIGLIDKLPSKDSTLLKALENLFVAGFSSPYRTIVNTTIVSWNETFGIQQSLAYPPTLENVLRARAVDADISLPTFPNSDEGNIPWTLPAFFDSQSQPSIDSSFPKLVNNVHRERQHLSASQPTAQSPYFTVLRSPLRQQVSVSSPANRATRSSAGLTPKPRLRHDNSQINFAPIDSSPLPTDNESQLLTEHQKEVKTRQFQDAQLFPDLSSSPLPKSTAMQRVVSKRLNFTSGANEQDENEDPGTPSGLPDANGLMSDDLPSSPTPSSTKDADQGVRRMDDDEEIDDAPEEPPSSPPRGRLDADDLPETSKEREPRLSPDETTASVTQYGVEHIKRPIVDEAPATSLEISLHGQERESNVDDRSSDFPSDSPLPTMQLQQEAEEAADAGSKVSNITNLDDGEHNPAPAAARLSQVENAERSQVSASMDIEEEQPGEVVSNDAKEEEVARVENSFLDPGSADVEMETQSTRPSQQIQRVSRKRKRSKSVLYPPKRRKQQSPFNRFTSYFLGQEEQQEDDDIGEEIVVASSQRSSSPIVQLSPEPASSPLNSGMIKPEPIAEPLGVVVNGTETSVTGAPTKRGRGRPRKSGTPNWSQTEHVTSKTLKRKASTLSGPTTTEKQVSSSFVKATPPRTKAGRQMHENVTQPSSASQENEQAGQGSLREKRGGSIIGRKFPNNNSRQTDTTDHVEPLDEADNDTVTPEQQLQAEQAAVTPERPIATPRSILKRLRDALTDFKGMILGSQEEREFDDVLFEFRREVHDAGRRGRVQ